MSRIGLALGNPEPDPRAPEQKPARGFLLAVLALLLAIVGGLALLAYRLNQRIVALEARMEALAGQAQQSEALARQNAERAVAAEGAAKAAAQGRQAAEVESATAREEADVAKQQALTASEEA